MSKHTAAPWEIASDPDGISSPRVIAPGLNDVCVICGAASNESVIADARLIAAAPDLLQALKVISVWAANGTGWKDLEDIRRLADESVNKATGDSND